MLCAQQRGCEGDVESQSLRFQFLPGFFRLGNSLFGKVRVFPAGEKIFQIPVALAVTHEHEKTIAHSKDSVFDCQKSLKPSTSAIEYSPGFLPCAHIAARNAPCAKIIRSSA